LAPALLSAKKRNEGPTLTLREPVLVTPSCNADWAVPKLVVPMSRVKKGAKLLL
jgi:hypothetical protein